MSSHAGMHGSCSTSANCSRHHLSCSPAGTPLIPSLLQTDGCLRQLAARLRSAGVGTGLLAAAAAGGSPTLSSSPQVPSAPGSSASGAGAESGGIAAMEQSHEVWNQLATAIQAGGVQQPELLTGEAKEGWGGCGQVWGQGSAYRRQSKGIPTDSHASRRALHQLPCLSSCAPGGELRKYQLKGLQWMVGLQRHGLNGILADEVGDMGGPV